MFGGSRIVQIPWCISEICIATKKGKGIGSSRIIFPGRVVRRMLLLLLSGIVGRLSDDIWLKTLRSGLQEEDRIVIVGSMLGKWEKLVKRFVDRYFRLVHFREYFSVLDISEGHLWRSLVGTRLLSDLICNYNSIVQGYIV